MNQATVTPRELAEAIGVSESSVKRWIDNGEITATKTAGGHRRVTQLEAVRYVRDRNVALARPELLGLSDLEAYRGSRFSDSEPDRRLFDCLRAGAESEARGLIMAQYLEGVSVAQIIDGPLRAAMAEVGELWLNETSGVLWEHRATQIVLQALVRLRSLHEIDSNAPVAVGGAPTGDSYILPSLAVATVLETRGLRAVNLGAETPIETLALGVEDLDARIAWLSVTAASAPAKLRDEILQLLPRFAERGTTLIVGGSDAAKLRLTNEGSVYVGASMAELDALVVGMTFAARRPAAAQTS